MAKKIQINKRDGANEGSIYDNPIDLPYDFGIVHSPGIVKRDDGSLEVSNIRIHRVGLEFVGTVSEEEYEIFGQTLLQIDTAYQWIVGDYLAYGVENNYGMAKDFAEKLDRSEGTINNWTSISRLVTFSRRRENLSFKHHVEVAPFSPEQQDYWLSLAENGNSKEGDEHKIWSVKRLREEIAKAQGEELESSNSVAVYERLADQFDNGLNKLLVQYKKAKTQRDKENIRRVIQNLVDGASRVLESLDDE